MYYNPFQERKEWAEEGVTRASLWKQDPVICSTGGSEPRWRTQPLLQERGWIQLNSIIRRGSGLTRVETKILGHGDTEVVTACKVLSLQQLGGRQLATFTYCSSWTETVIISVKLTILELHSFQLGIISSSPLLSLWGTFFNEGGRKVSDGTYFREKPLTCLKNIFFNVI